MPLRNLAVLPIKIYRPEERRKIEEQNFAAVEESFKFDAFTKPFSHLILLKTKITINIVSEFSSFNYSPPIVWSVFWLSES